MTFAPSATASSTNDWLDATAFSSISGPIETPSSVPRPIFMAVRRSVIFFENSAATPRCTNTRLAAVQAWPMLRNLATIAPSTALSRSASSNTMNGAFPPSSIDVRSTLSAACLSRILPTPVEPVNDNLRRRESPMITGDTSRVREVVSTFTTPRGTPASSNSLTNARVVNGVSSAGLMIEVQPAAIAGAILRVAIAKGKFHGVMRKQGPTGCLDTTMVPVPSGFEP